MNLKKEVGEVCLVWWNKRQLWVQAAQTETPCSWPPIFPLFSMVQISLLNNAQKQKPQVSTFFFPFVRRSEQSTIDSRGVLEEIEEREREDAQQSNQQLT